MKRFAPRRGFSLIEILGMLLLLGVFMLISSELFITTFRTERQASGKTDLIDRFDTLAARLRRDVWSASAIEAAGSQLRLAQREGPVVTWGSGSDGTVTRTVGDKAVLWHKIPPLRFDARGPLVTLYLEGADGDETASFVSQQMLLNPGGAQ